VFAQQTQAAASSNETSTASASVDTKSMFASMLNNNSKDFVPKGKHAITDDLFPTLGGDSDEPKGKKKKGKAVVVQQ
jgi:hypothetical protein